VSDSTSFFLTVPSEDTPLYEQIYSSVRAAILSGALKPGEQLPSTRALATQLNVSRNTVLGAYHHLEAEGYLRTAAGSGTFVAPDLPESLLGASRVDPRPSLGETDSEQHRLSDAGNRLLALSRGIASSPIPTIAAPRPFRADIPALDAFPFALWSRLVVRQARRMPPAAFPYQDSRGYRPLREAIAAHVAVSRQVHCTADQVLIVGGSQGALDLAARLLLNPGDPVWMEDPGYLGARGAFLSAGAHIVPVSIDEEGLMVDVGVARAPSARLAYLTPSHQFPLGVTMSLARRLAILEWAERTGAYLLEDDYDSEYRYAGRPLAALHGLDRAQRVIYIGTFSKVLFPGLRLGYLILPPALVEPFLAMRRFIDTHPPWLEQAVVAEFLAGGHFARHLRRMRALYAERRTALLEAFRPLPLDMQSPEAGIHCVGWLSHGLDLASLLRGAAAHDLELTPLSAFSIDPPERHGLILGYGGLSVQEIKSGAKRLAAALRAA